MVPSTYLLGIILYSYKMKLFPLNYQMEKIGIINGDCVTCLYT